MKYHAAIGIGTFWKDSECEHDWRCISFMDKIGIVSRSSDSIDKGKFTCPYCVWVPQDTGTGNFFTRDDKQNRGTNPMPTFATRPSTTSSTIPTARLPMGLIPIWRRWRSCGQTLCRTSSLFWGQPRSRILRFLRTVVLFFVELVDCEGWFCSLAESLQGARRAIVCILFSLEQSRVVDWVVAEVLLRLARESDVSSFEFFQLSSRRRHASPRQFDRIALCLFLSTRCLTTKFCTFCRRNIANISSGSFRAFSDVPFWASYSLCRTFLVFQKVRVWLHDCSFSW